MRGDRAVFRVGVQQDYEREPQELLPRSVDHDGRGAGDLFDLYRDVWDDDLQQRFLLLRLDEDKGAIGSDF